MQPMASDHRWTLEEFYALPDDGRRHELEGGYLVSEPLAGFRHGSVTARIVCLLGAFAHPRRLGTVLTADSGYLLARDPVTLRGPDVSFVSRARVESLEDSIRAFPGAPDLAVEVVFPSNRPSDIHAKVADYLAAGSRLVWVVDPEHRTVAVYRSLLLLRVLCGEDRLEGEDVLPGFAVALREIFED